MALIKCNHCGKMVSDRADKCPHCGNNPREEQVEPQVNTTEKQVELEEETPSSGVNKPLITIVAVLAVIAIGFACYLCFGTGSGKTESMPVDSVAIDSDNVEAEVDTTIIEEEGQEQSVEADSASYDASYSEQSAANEEGFHSDRDVMDFVTGNSYSHDGVTLRITEDAVFANDNEISQSRPVFRQLSNETGRITARPSISITVKRSDNKLVDNKSGDVYDFQY